MLLYTVIPPREIRVTDPRSGSSAGKESTCNVGDPSLIPGSGRSTGEGIGYTLQYSCLNNPHGQGSLVGYSLWGPTSQTLLSD